MIDDFVLVSCLDLFEMINGTIVGRYGKCKFPRKTSMYSTCAYSIGVDARTKLGRIFAFDKDMEKE
jgi:hypothetical protein